MVKGRSAAPSGAEGIPTGLPGVAYVVEDGIPEPARIRFAYLSDDDLQTLSRRGLRAIEGSEAA